MHRISEVLALAAWECLKLFGFFGLCVYVLLPLNYLGWLAVALVLGALFGLGQALWLEWRRRREEGEG